MLPHVIGRFAVGDVAAVQRRVRRTCPDQPKEVTRVRAWLAAAVWIRHPVYVSRLEMRKVREHTLGEPISDNTEVSFSVDNKPPGAGGNRR